MIEFKIYNISYMPGSDEGDARCDYLGVGMSGETGDLFRPCRAWDLGGISTWALRPRLHYAASLRLDDGMECRMCMFGNEVDGVRGAGGAACWRARLLSWAHDVIVVERGWIARVGLQKSAGWISPLGARFKFY